MNSTPTDILQEVSTCSLGKRVHDDFIRARDARSSTNELLLECFRQRKGEYSVDELKAMGTIKTFINATSTKCRGGESWLDDVLSSIRGRPWTLNPTPVVDAPLAVRDSIVAKIKEEVVGRGGDPKSVDGYIRERAEQLKDVSMTLLNEEAAKAAEGMSKRIEDQLAQGGFETAFAEFRTDLVTFPYAVLKGPVVRSRKVLSWKGNSGVPVVSTVNQLVVERVDPFNFYWASWAATPNEGYIVERMTMTVSAINDCIGVPSFDEDKIREALEKYENGLRVSTPTDSQQEHLQNNTMTLQMGDTLDVLDYWGPIKGSLLREWGVKGDIDELNTYEVNVWVVGDICIRAVLNPDPLGKRVYHVSSYEKVPSSIVGRSVPMLMKAHQEIINSSYRALRRNMGLASGPFAEVDKTRLAEGQAPEELVPGMIKLVTPDLSGGGQAAYRFHNIDSNAAELVSTIQHEVRACDDATGIPAYSYGNSASSGAGRTVGGLAMLMGNAAKGIKKVIGHIERDVLEPLITTMYNYNMLYDPDSSIKVDAQVVARGPTGVIMQDALVQRRLEGLQLITPYVGAGVVPPKGVAVLLREILKGLDMPVDKIIPDPEKQEQLQGVADATNQGVNQSPNQPNVVGGVAKPALTLEQMQGSTVQPSAQGQVAMQPGQLGQGTVATAVPDGRSGLASQMSV